jgi:hypothetical protein
MASIIPRGAAPTGNFMKEGNLFPPRNKIPLRDLVRLLNLIHATCSSKPLVRVCCPRPSASLHRPIQRGNLIQSCNLIRSFIL